MKSDAARSWEGSAVLGRQRGLGKAARSWEGSAVLGVSPTRALPWFPPLALCRGFPHSRFAVVSPTRALPWFPPLALCRGFPHSRFAVVSPTRALHQDNEKDLTKKPSQKLAQVKEVSPTLKTMHELKEKIRQIFD
ncbi:MAG: transposase, partial [Moorea sp. SIO4A3]|nr:transposase [Moorena sp. SIO4A3]